MTSTVIVVCPLQGVGTGVDVDLVGSLEAFSSLELSKSYIFIYCTRSSFSRMRLSNINVIPIFVPSFIEKNFIRKLFQGRFFSIFVSFVGPFQILHSVTNFFSPKTHINLHVMYGSFCGLFTRLLFKSIGCKSTAHLSLTGMPTWLKKKYPSYYKKLEANFLRFLTLNFVYAGFDTILCLSTSTASRKTH